MNLQIDYLENHRHAIPKLAELHHAEPTGDRCIRLLRMTATAAHQLSLLVLGVVVLLAAPAHGREQAGTPSSLKTRAEREAFLSKASVGTDAPTDGRLSWRATLDVGARRHYASVVT